MKSYASVPQHAIQGRAILERIDDYKKTHGDFPNRQWFDSLGDLSVTNEGHHWFYFNPPRNVGIRGGLLICTATDYGNQYLGGFVDGAVVMTRLKIQEAEQAGTGQPATRPLFESDGSDKPQPEAEGRSR